MLRIVATAPDQLDEIPIHDAWFDVDTLRVVVDALRVEASGGTEIVGWSRRRVGRFGGVSDTPRTRRS